MQSIQYITGSMSILRRLVIPKLYSTCTLTPGLIKYTCDRGLVRTSLSVPPRETPFELGGTFYHMGHFILGAVGYWATQVCNGFYSVFIWDSA